MCQFQSLDAGEMLYLMLLVGASVSFHGGTRAFVNYQKLSLMDA